MKVIMNSGFFDTINPFQYVWPALVHASLETMGTWAFPEGQNYKSLRMEYYLDEKTAIQTFRITDLNGEQVYVQDVQPLPCVKGGEESIKNTMELLNMVWKDDERVRTQTAFNQCHKWFSSWVVAWLKKEVEKVDAIKPPTCHKLCDRLIEGI